MSVPSALRGRLEAWFKTLQPSDVWFALVLCGFSFAAARVWWITTIVPGMDYPQFLLFVRALQDYSNPSSPFHGTYTVASWYLPTSLPIHLTSWISYLCGHSIETAGKVLLTMQNLGLIAGTLYVLKLLGRNRWAILLLFPLIHSSWTVVGGFAAYATSLPLNVLAWALTVRWLHRLDVRSGVALALCLSANLFWHGVGFAQAGFGFLILWLIWRAPSWRARVLSVLPTFPCLAHCAAWMGTTFADKAARGGPPNWLPPWEASEKVFEYMWTTVPHYGVRALALALIVGVGLLLSQENLGGTGPTSRMWRVRNPFLFLSLAYFASYYACPMYLNKVEGVSTRFPYVASLAFVLAWNLPAARLARGAVLLAAGCFAAWCLQDITQRFHAFDEDTRGASDLIDQVGLHETLYFSPPGQGASKDFDGPTNKPMRELQQYASIRHGGLPNSSFAGYGINYIRYVDNRNPMPGLGGMGWTPQMTKFDYVLTRANSPLTDTHHFQLYSRVQGWNLYGVCGSTRFPTCP